MPESIGKLLRALNPYNRKSSHISSSNPQKDAVDRHNAERDTLLPSSPHKPCEPVPREDIKKEFEEYKEYIREEYLRTEAGQDILGRIAWGQLYEDKDVKVEGELLEKDANKLRNITRKFMRNRQFKEALMSRKIKPMKPKTIDELLALIPDTDEFNCLVDPTFRYKALKSSKGSSKEDKSGQFNNDDLSRLYYTEHGGGKNKRKTNKRKTNKRKTRRY
jgi:hypothetical protein